MTERLLDLLDVCADIESVRRIILQAAVRGLLVPQKHSDGSVAELLDDLRQDVQASGRVWSDPVPSDIGIDAGHSLPPSWTWVRLDNVVTFGPKNGYSPKPSVHPTRTKTLTLTATTSGHFDGRHFKYVDETIDNASSLWLRDGDILIQRSNTIAYVGAAAVYRGEPHEFIYPDLMMKVRASCAVSTDYIHLVLLAPPARSFLRARASGTAGSMPKVNQAAVLGIPIPLPPLAEQKRIVAKVEQLMALCDELEAKQAKKREVGDRLTKAAFGALMSADTPAAVHDAWRDIATNLRALVDRAEIVTELRKAVVELAMRGGLTSRAADGMAVEMLLDKIRADVGSKARPKNVVQSGDDDAPFLIPETWRWVRWGDLVVSTSSGWSPQCESRPRNEGEWGVLKVSAVSWFEFKPEENKALPPGTAPRPELAVRDDDFLISRANTAELVGRSVVVKDAPPRLILSDKLVRCEFSRWVDKRFINLYNRTATTRAHYVANASGTSDSMKNISRDVILTMPVPLPPLAEQQEIVARVEHFMTLCDDLEARLRARDEKAARLAEALVAQMLA